MANPLSIAGSIAGLITISQSALYAVRSLIKSIKEYDENIIRLAQEIAAVQQLLELLKEALSEYGDRSIQGVSKLESLRLLRLTLEQIEELNPRHKKRDKIPFILFRKDKEIDKLLSRLERHKSTISGIFSTHQMSLLGEALSNQAGISQLTDTFRK